MSATLAIEALLLRPDLPQLAAELRRTLPTDLLDLLDNAATTAHDGMVASATALGGDMRYAATADVPGWLRLSVIEAMVGYVTGQGSTCRHSPDPRRPQPVTAAAWRPGLVTCPPCAYLLGATGDADRTCDHCGHVCAGLDDGDPVYPGMVQLGPLIYQYGTCSDCRVDEPAR